jgi:hypothetical protein
MLDLLLFGFQHLVGAVGVWVAVFVLVAVVVAVPITRWAVSRMHRARAVGVVVGGGQAFFLTSWILVVLYIVPVAVAVVHAAPFAVGRSLADTLEHSTPKAADWMVDLAGPNLMKLLQVAGEQVILDADALRARAAAALDDAGDRTKHFLGPGRVRELATDMLLTALHDELDDIAPGVKQITWHDVMARVKTAVASGSSLFVMETVLGLRAAAWAALFSGLTLLGACHVATILLFLLVVRPRAASVEGVSGTRSVTEREI